MNYLKQLEFPTFLIIYAKQEVSENEICLERDESGMIRKQLPFGSLFLSQRRNFLGINVFSLTRISVIFPLKRFSVSAGPAVPTICSL